MRMHRLVLIVVLLSIITTLAACSAEQVRENITRTEAATQKAIDAKAKVDAAIGVAATLPESEQVGAIRAALPPENQPGFDKAIAAGTKAIDVAKNVSTALGGSATELMQQLELLRTRLASAQDTDDATFETITWALGAAVPILTPIIGAIAFFRGRNRGQVEGALHVTNSVKAGRAADSNFDAMFNGRTGDVMKAALATKPGLAAVVKANKTV